MEAILAFDITISGSAVAWYAAVVATGSCLVVAYTAWRDRVNLRVSATLNMRLTESCALYSENRNYILIEVSNVGRRPMQLRAFPWFTIKGQKKPVYIVKGPWQPKDILNEGQSASMLCNQETLDVPLSALERIVVRDATGREWKGRIKREE